MLEGIERFQLEINADDEDITPYATFTLKPICGTDTTRSLMSAPSAPATDSQSNDSIEGATRLAKQAKKQNVDVDFVSFLGDGSGPVRPPSDVAVHVPDGPAEGAVAGAALRTALVRHGRPQRRLRRNLRRGLPPVERLLQTPHSQVMRRKKHRL